MLRILQAARSVYRSRPVLGQRTFWDAFDLKEPIREGEADDVLRRSLRYQSKQRGWKENDLMLGAFTEKRLSQFSRAELEEYDALLRRGDHDIFSWALGKAQAPAEFASVVSQLQAFVKSAPFDVETIVKHG
eukprot:EC714400.1.p1 GENE.EC714400.1~~EC714400.1.p1  ORF type:complete len:132 (+),score=19.88 EC714400.1:102-497(+)